MNETLRVLLVEDNPADIDLIHESLEEGGYTSFLIESVSRLSDALARLERSDFDLVLLDLGLPDSQGLETFKKIHSAQTDIPVVVLTGNDDQELAVTAVREGAQDYIIKNQVVGNVLVRASKYAVERKRNEKDLRESEQKLKEAQRIGRIGHWEYDIKTQKIIWSDMVFTLYERDPELGPPTMEEEASYYSPEDAERLHNLARITIETRKPYETEEAVKLPEGRIRYFIAKGTPVINTQGRVIKLLGTVQDITDIKKAEIALKDSEEKYRGLFDNSTDFVYTLDLKGNFLDVNRSAELLTGYTQSELIGMNFRNYTSQDTGRKLFRAFKKVFKTGDPLQDFPFEVIIKDGSMKFFETSVTRLYKGDKIIGFQGISRDVTEHRRIDEAVRESRRKFRELYDEAPVGYHELDREGYIVNVNMTEANMLGFTIHEMLGKPIFDFIVPQERKQAKNTFSSKIEKRQTIRGFERKYQCKNGDVIDVHIEDRLVLDEKENIIGIRSTVQNITERIKSVEALRKSEEHYRSLFENMLNGFAYCKMLFDQGSPHDFIYLNVNSAFESLTGLKNVVGKKVSEVIPGIQELDPELFEIYGRVALTGKPERFEILLKSLKMWLSIAVFSPEKEYFVAIFDVITERKKAEEALKMFRMLIDQSNDYVEVIDPQTGRFLDVNEKGCRDHGYSREEFLSLSVFDIDPTVDQSSFKGFMEETRKSDSLRLEGIHRRKDGSTFPVEVNIKYVRLDRDYLIAVARNITERKRAEEERRISEERYLQLFNEAPIGYQELDIEGKIVRVNKTEADMMGYTIDEMIGKTVFDFISPDQREDSKIRYKKRIQKQLPSQSFERKYITKSGKYLYVSITDKLVFDEKNRVTSIRSTLQDITKRKLAEEERILLVTAIEQASECVVITDVNGTIQYINPAFEKITGYSKDEAIGHNLRFLKSGKQDEVFYKDLWDTITGGKQWSGRFINKKKDGQLYTEEASITPIEDSTGAVTNFAAVKRDVTNELIMEQRLRETQKIEAIGTLAGGIAHDFNNILAGIIGYTELSLDTVPEESQLHSDLTKIFKAGHRARDLVDQILTFSRQREHEKKPIQITPIIKESLKLLRASLPSTIEIRQNIESEPGTVMADPTQIHQVIMNLCTNAGHAMREKGGILKISLCSKELDSEFCLNHPGSLPGPHLKLMVSDTGHGIPPDMLPKIFEPYFTTKEKTGGTGLGLSVVHGIITGCGGTVTVYSEPGKGTTFKVYLPVTTQKPVSEVEKTKPVSRGHERILLIDDEQDIVDVGKRILEQLGYTVTDLTSSINALELFQKDPYQFDLVITDMTMPFMTGDELAQELMRIRQDIPVIICTGYSEKLTEEKALSIGIKAYLGKPLLKSEITETIRRVLDEKIRDA